jgi:superfamily II DNA or RNA helicase
MLELYKTYIYERYKTLKESKTEFDNNDLWKIFEYYTCIMLKEKYNKNFYEYNDIPPEFKELKNMTKNDSGIDCCDLENIIVQCKLRKKTLTWNDCATFFASTIIKTNNELNVKWKELIIARNEDSKLSSNLLQQKDIFTDMTFKMDEVLKYCEDLLLNFKPIEAVKEKFILRDYQNKAIELIKKSKNIIISIPTGCGKNSIIIFSMIDGMRYLILVPRIILMEQMKSEIIEKRPELKKYIQCLGDGKNIYNNEKLITICVYNSVALVENEIFDKIYIDEAHHIRKPEIYKNDDFEEVADVENIKEVEIIKDENIKEVKIVKDDNNEFKEGFDDENLDKEDFEDTENLDDEDENLDEEDFEDENLDEEDFEDENFHNETIEEYEPEDIEDELKDIKNYTNIIRNFKNQENNVYLSATIDECENFEYYSKDIREMINLKYLCDYTINIPIFSNDPSNKNVCEYLIKNYRNVIIYCGSRAEGKKINDLMNVLQNGICEYIDCFTKKKQRNEILNKYKNGDIVFLVNVKILVEGFDAPITKGVCFLHLPSDKTTLIQIIGRCLRLHKDKNISNVILPFNNNDEEKIICKFLNIMACNDSRIRESYKNKKLGGYVSIEKNIVDEKDIEDVEFKYECVYDSMGLCLNREEMWFKHLDELKGFIDKYERKPNKKDNKSLCYWVNTQNKNYKKNSEIMKNKKIKNMWNEFITNEKYSKYFLLNENVWFQNFELLKTFIDKHGEKPTKKNNKYLYGWWRNQITNYKHKKDIMKDENIYVAWNEFMTNEKYNKYFISNVNVWFQKFELLKNFIDEYNKLPSKLNDEILNNWWTKNNQIFKNKCKIMKNKNIYTAWSQFISEDKYKFLFYSNEELWFQIFELLKKYIGDNKKKPSIKEEKKLNLWMNNQITHYKKKKDIMKNENIYVAWNNFVNDEKYKCYFCSNEELWFQNFELLKKYINDNKTKPSVKDDKSLNMWWKNQSSNYKSKQQIMKDENVYATWSQFITDDKYSKFF